MCRAQRRRRSASEVLRHVSRAFSWKDFDDRRVHSVTCDVRHIPPDTEALEVETKRFTDWDGLASLARLRRLAVQCVRAEHLPHIARLSSLTGLWLSEVRGESLAPLRSLVGLQSLRIHWATKLADLGDVAALRGLRTLHLWDLPKLASFEGVQTLTELREFTYETAPSRDARGPQRFPSLTPLGALARLERLRLVGVATVDDSLAPLRGLHALRDLHMTNAFPLEEFARLAAALPQARGNFSEPIWQLPGRVDCAKCAGEKVLLLGRGRRLCCARCDAERIARHIAEFERIRSGG